MDLISKSIKKLNSSYKFIVLKSDNIDSFAISHFFFIIHHFHISKGNISWIFFLRKNNLLILITGMNIAIAMEVKNIKGLQTDKWTNGRLTKSYQKSLGPYACEKHTLI